MATATTATLEGVRARAAAPISNHRPAAKPLCPVRQQGRIFLAAGEREAAELADCVAVFGAEGRMGVWKCCR